MAETRKRSYTVLETNYNDLLVRFNMIESENNSNLRKHTEAVHQH